VVFSTARCHVSGLRKEGYSKDTIDTVRAPINSWHDLRFDVRKPFSELARNKLLLLVIRGRC
jgi:hypothetical protein